MAEKFEAVGVPAGPINTLAEVFNDPQVIARNMRVDLPHPDAKGGTIPGVRSPMTINGRRAVADRAPPKLGEHTEEVLREIGEA
jgi:crotonobetainyl-CoA:carnitine CoA-transferase CaiB-like acyl-CoA transferase